MRRWAGFFFGLSAVLLAGRLLTGDSGQAADQAGSVVDMLVRKAESDGWGSLIAAGASALIGLVLLLLRTRGDQQSDAVKNPVQPKG